MTAVDPPDALPRRMFGTLRHLEVPDDLAPLPDEELERWEA